MSLLKGDASRRKEEEGTKLGAEARAKAASRPSGPLRATRMGFFSAAGPETSSRVIVALPSSSAYNHRRHPRGIVLPLPRGSASSPTRSRPLKLTLVFSLPRPPRGPPCGDVSIGTLTWPSVEIIGGGTEREVILRWAQRERVPLEINRVGRKGRSANRILD